MCKYYNICITLQNIDCKELQCFDCDKKEEAKGNFDISVLRFLSTFNYVHVGFSLFAGIMHISMGEDSFFTGWLSTINSLLNMMEVTALMIFLIELKGKVSIKIFINYA